MRSDPDTALHKGRAILRVEMPIPVGFDALPLHEKHSILRERFSESYERAVSLIVERE